MEHQIDLFQKDKKQKAICPHCGAKNVEYRFSFNEGLAIFLRKLKDAGGIAKTDDLGLTYSQRTNSQKLRYWKLAEPYLNAEGKKKRGWWKITTLGEAFINGLTKIQHIAVTVRGSVIRHEGKQIYIKDVMEGWKYHGDYADQARRQIREANVG